MGKSSSNVEFNAVKQHQRDALRKRIIWTLVAVVVAGIVFWITLQADTKKTDPTKNTIAPIEGGWDNGGGQTGDVEDAFVEMVDGDVLYQFFGDKIEPLPQGVLEMQRPMARIHLIRDQRVIQIEADSGTFVAPDNRPRSGDFKGNVLLTLFESAPGMLIDFANDSPDAQLRLTLQNASFNRDLGEIRSSGPVHAISREFEFRGEDLDLIYNELRERIDRLEIAGGDQIRIRSALSETSMGKKDDDAKGGQQAKADQSTDEKPVQYYKINFSDAVEVQSDGSTMAGEQLAVLMGMRLPDSDSDEADEATDVASNVSENEDATANAAARDLSPLPKTLEPMDSDIFIKWRGPMLLSPLDKKPETLRDSDDVQLTMAGTPLRITPRGGQLVTASELAYVDSQQRVQLSGSNAFPLLLESDDLGTLRGEKMELDLAAQTGRFIGPGSLRAKDTLTNSDEDASSIPADTSIRWQNGIDLVFYTDDELASEAGDEESSAFSMLKDVIFRGDVNVDHVKFDLAGDVLSLGFTLPVDGEQMLRRLTTSGNVKFRSHSAVPEDRITVDSDQLDVKVVDTEDGKTRVDRIVATGNVKAEQLEADLYANRLTVNLIDPDAPVVEEQIDPSLPTATKALDIMLSTTGSDKQLTFDESDTGEKQQPKQAEAAADDEDELLEIRNIVADGDVRIVLKEDSVTAYADRLVADGKGERVQLFGTDKADARLVREDGTLLGKHMVLMEASESLMVLGAGRLKTNSVAENDDSPLEVTWQENMQFHNKTGIAKFFGKVVAAGEKVNEKSKLQSDELIIAFHKFENLQRALQSTGELGRDEALPSEQADAGGESESALKQGLRKIKTITADGNVIFESSSWKDKVGGELATRMYLTGPSMIFDNMVSELFTVKGAGKLLVEDHRDEEEKVEPATDENEKSAEVQITGKGATLFVWHKSFQIDFVHNDLKMEEQVQILHIPEGEEDQFQLDCRKIVADLQAVGGIGVWMNSNAPAPQLRAIYADDNVTVRSRGRRMDTDHLEYTDFDNTIVLRANEGKLTHISEDNGSSGSARLFRWNLDTDRMEVIDPGRTVAPTD